MPDFLRRNSLLLSSLFLVFASLQLMASSIENPALPRAGAKLFRTILSPVELSTANFFLSIESLWDRYLWLGDVQQNNKLLLKQLKRLELDNITLKEKILETSRFDDLLGLSEELGFKSLTARVIGKDSSKWVDSVTIDIGRNDGVRVGNAVLDGSAVVGKLTVVGPKSSKVLLLTDSVSAIDAVVQRTRAPGVVESVGDGQLVMRYVVKEDDISVGDQIVSSGLDGAYPKGILIGIVTRVESEVAGLFHRVHLRPSANLRKLETVLLVKEWVNEQ